MIPEFWVNSAQIQPLSEVKFGRPLLYDVISSIRMESIPAGDSFVGSPEGTELDVRYFAPPPTPGRMRLRSALALDPKQRRILPSYCGYNSISRLPCGNIQQPPPVRGIHPVN